MLVEWPERAGDLMPSDHWLIRLDVPDEDPLLRDIEVSRVGSPPGLVGFPMSVTETP